VRNVVLTPPAANGQARAALVRALARFPATIEELPIADRGARLIACAADADVEWIAVIDADVTLQADAFGALRRAAGPQTAIIGGRALLGDAQRLGEMFGPARSGPNPFELTQLIAAANDRNFAELVRGPIDVPQRGAYVVSAAFVRSLGGIELDGVLLHLDLAVQAHVRGFDVTCEPALTFTAGEDSLPYRRALSALRRYAALGTWDAADLHREPIRFRGAFITREVRMMGNIRGYARRAFPPVDVIAFADDEIARARAQRGVAKLAVNGTAVICTSDDGDALRRALARTGERYLLVADGHTLPDRATVEMLAERIERSGRIALALEHDAPPYGATLIHCGRIANAGALAGASIAEVIAAAIETLPQRRVFAATPAGRVVPEPLPRTAGLAGIDLVFIAASKPAVTQQSLVAVMGEPIEGTIMALYPAGAATTEKVFGAHAGVRLVPDASDVQLAVGLNRVLGSCLSDGVAIVRDDAQLPHGALARLTDAFRRIPGLGIAVPRIGGTGRPEGISEVGYRSSAEMQQIYERRAEQFARESTLLEVATAPVMVVSREALEVVGGFDEMFGFSRIGIEDFSRRVRAANFLIAVCDDAYAHLFSPDDAQSFVGNLDAAPFLRAAYEKRWSVPRGFDPATDRVPLRTFEVPAAAAPAAENTPALAVRILLPLRDEADWERALPLLRELALEFRAHDPIDVAVGLDGTFGLQSALSGLRELLLAANVPMEETLNVSIDFVGDVAAWRDASANNRRAAGFERDELNGVAPIASAAEVRALLTAPIG
jgi:hypothetical protein